MWHILLFSVLFKANLCYPIFFQLKKKKKALERKTKHNSNFSELGPKYFLGFVLPSCCSADQAPWTPFPSDLPGGMYTLLKPLVLNTTAWLKTPSLQVCCLGLPVLRTISRSASAPQDRENSSAFLLLLLFISNNHSWNLKTNESSCNVLPPSAFYTAYHVKGLISVSVEWWIKT